MNYNEVIRSDEDRKKIISYLREELGTVVDGDERKGLELKWGKWRRQAQARPEFEVKNFPWKKASNIMPPLMATNVNGVYASLKSTYSPRRPFWDVSSIDPKLQDQVKAVNTYLDVITESSQHLNLRRHNNTILYDLALMGNKFVKVPWLIDYWSFKRKDSTGNMVKVNKLVHDSATIFPIRMEDYFQPLYISDPQRSPWISTRYHYTYHELLQRQDQGIYNNVEDVLKRGGDKLDDNMKEELERWGLSVDETKRMESSIYDIHEMNVFWDVDGDGIPEDVIIWFDPITGTILREEFNDLGIRDTVNIPYLLLPDQLYAMGVGWMSEYLQDEIEALHNMRIDGTQLSMLQMYVSKRGAGLSSDEEFRPLKNLELDNPREDFIPIKFPDIGPSSIQAEMLAKEYSDRFTGASDYQMGFENRNVATRATASGTMFLAQQGSKIFQAITENVDEGYSQIGQILVFQLVKNKDRVDFTLIPEEQRESLKEVLNMNIEDIPSAFNFKVKTTEIQNTEEMKRQKRLTLAQLYSMYAEKMLSLTQIFTNQQMPPDIKQVAMKFFVGATEMMSETLKDFGELNTEKYLPYTKQIELMLNAIDAMKAQQVNQIQGGLNVRGNPNQVSDNGAGGGGPGYTSGGNGLMGSSQSAGNAAGGPPESGSQGEG